MSDLQKELIKTNAQAATGTAPKNPYQIRNAKRTIARILTMKRESELEAAAKVVIKAKDSLQPQKKTTRASTGKKEAKQA